MNPKLNQTKFTIDLGVGKLEEEKQRLNANTQNGGGYKLCIECEKGTESCNNEQESVEER